MAKISGKSKQRIGIEILGLSRQNNHLADNPSSNPSVSVKGIAGFCQTRRCSMRASEKCVAAAPQGGEADFSYKLGTFKDIGSSQRARGNVGAENMRIGEDALAPWRTD